MANLAKGPIYFGPFLVTSQVNNRHPIKYDSLTQLSH